VLTHFLYFWFITTSLMWRKINRKFIIYYLSQEKHCLQILSTNGKAILTSRMIIWENFFSFNSLCSNLMLRLSSIKCLTMYSTQIFKIGYRSDDVCTFCIPSQKRYTISFFNGLNQGIFGTILNLIGAFYKINRFVFLCRMLNLV